MPSLDLTELTRTEKIVTFDDGTVVLEGEKGAGIERTNEIYFGTISEDFKFCPTKILKESHAPEEWSDMGYACLMKCSSDGLITCCNLSLQLEVWDAKECKRLREYNMDTQLIQTSNGQVVRWVSNGAGLAWTHIDVLDGHFKRIRRLHYSAGYSTSDSCITALANEKIAVAMSPQSSSEQAKILIIDLNGTTLAELHLDRVGTIHAIAALPNEKVILEYSNKTKAYGSRVLSVVDLATQQTIVTLNEDPNHYPVFSIVSEKYLVTGEDKVLKLWNMETWKCEEEIKLDSAISSIALLHTHANWPLAICTRDHGLQFRELATLKKAYAAPYQAAVKVLEKSLPDDLLNITMNYCGPGLFNKSRALTEKSSIGDNVDSYAQKQVHR